MIPDYSILFEVRYIHFTMGEARFLYVKFCNNYDSYS